MSRASLHELERFRAVISRQIGLWFEDSKFGFLSEVLRRRLEELGRGNDYIGDLERQPSQGEFAALARELTVGETFFFRNIAQFQALAEVALPDRTSQQRTPKLLRLLSAGCSSGEEAYSMAIVARETIADLSWKIEIRAVDLNPNALEKAARARYSAWALRETPTDIRSRWFRADDRDFVLDDGVRAAVKIEPANLAGDDPNLWPSAHYDVIFCRNVLMYFTPDQMRATIARISAALAPGGYLFLGHAETLRGISDDFHLCHTHHTFYYRRKQHSDCGCPREIDFIPAAKPAAAPTLALTTAWIDTIHQASARVASLIAATNTAKAPKRARANDWELRPALELLRHERFSEALDHVRRGPPETADDPDVLLVKAALLSHSGELAAAAAACRRLLQLDELSAGAHYVLALCREQDGERERAMEHDRVAAHLDPGFAMPRLHCGLLARHAGDRAGARRELQQALVLLKREDVSRLLLFGGGFTRDALIGICQSAVAECRGRP
jgi:chemotaxis protein methyltransferase CheR